MPSSNERIIQQIQSRQSKWKVLEDDSEDDDGNIKVEEYWCDYDEAGLLGFQWKESPGSLIKIDTKSLVSEAVLLINTIFWVDV